MRSSSRVRALITKITIAICKLGRARNGDIQQGFSNFHSALFRMLVWYTAISGGTTFHWSTFNFNWVCLHEGANLLGGAIHKK